MLVSPSDNSARLYVRLYLSMLIKAPIFVFPVRDMGAWVLAAFKDPETWMNKDMRLVTEWLSTREMARIASNVTGKEIRCLEVNEELFHESQNAPWLGAKSVYLNYLFFVKVYALPGKLTGRMERKVV